MSKPYLPACAFIVGAAVMAIEMTASRVLAPFFGASLFVWTALIVTVLLSMSVGYWFGGRLVGRDDGGTLGFLLSLSSAVLLFGLWIVHALSRTLSDMLSAFGNAGTTLFLGSLLLSFAAFSLPVFVLAMAGPVILGRWSGESGDVGRTAGRYFALSTAGSVFGTLLPSLYLVPTFGVRVTIVGVAAALLAVGVPLLRSWLRPAFAAAGVALAIAVLVQGGAVTPGTVYETESPYQHVRVEEHDGDRYLIFNEGWGIQSVLLPARRRTGYYYDHFAAVPFLNGGDGRGLRAVVLGLAGGSLVRQFMTALPQDSALEMVGVELDGRVIEVARDWFGLDELPVRVVKSDGRAFLDTADDLDVVIVDAYGTQLYIPPHMSTQEFFRKVKGALKEDGLMAINVNAAERDSPLLAALTNTVASVFPYTYISKAGNTWNWLVVGGMRPPDYLNASLHLPDGYEDVAESMLAAERVEYDPESQVLTDDRAPIELMTDNMILMEAMKSHP